SEIRVMRVSLRASWILLLGSFAFIALPSATPQDTVKSPYPLATQPTQSFGARQLHHGSRIQSLLFVPAGTFPEDPNQSLLIAGGGNDPIRVWNPETGQLVKTINSPWAQALAWDAKEKS